MKRKVLIVDHQAGTRRQVQQALHDCGHAVFEADHGTAAMRLIRALQPDLLVLNWALPGSPDGQALLQALPGTPCLVLDARLSPTERQAAWEAGARQFLRVPFLPSQLREAVAALLDGGASPLQ